MSGFGLKKWLALAGCATTVKAPEIPLLDGNSFSQAQAAPEPKRPGAN